MEADLVKAIQKDEFVVYLQPQYNNTLKRITGFEALVRWNNPKYLKRSPQEFITLAEENNLIIDIGNIVMEKTFEIARKLKGFNLTISLNVSPVQLLQQGFVADFLDKYNKYGLKTGSISIEITETYLVQSFSLINEKLLILRKNGIGIHLDDFGTGYSSLPYLKELVFDKLKIDREYIMHLENDKYHKAIVNMIITLSKSLDVDIIAEGVENDAQNNYLFKQGCSTIQGYLVGPAVNYEEALLLIQDYNINKTKVVDVKGGK